jgi:hypothetical protein
MTHHGHLLICGQLTHLYQFATSQWRKRKKNKKGNHELSTSHNAWPGPTVSARLGGWSL